MHKFTRKLLVLVLALAVAMMPVAAGAATKSSSTKTTKTTATKTATTSKTKATTTTTQKTTTKTETQTTTTKKTETAEKSDKTDEKVEETAEEETYPKVTYKVSDIVIELDQYFVFATGNAIEPAITTVSGKVTETTTTKVEVVVEKTESKSDAKVEDKTDEKSETTEKTDEKSESKTDEKVEEKTETKTELKNETKTFDKTFTESEYTVKYYKIVGEKYKEVEEIKDIGEYAIRICLSEPYEETADVLFSVIGTPQTLTVSKTKFSMHVGDTVELSPSATGDGTGFSYYVSRKGIVDVAAGMVVAKKPGIVEITVKTKGNKLSQPATVKVEITVKPDKVTWNKVSKGKKSTTLSWSKQSVTGYNIRYCTEKTFKKPAKTAKNYKSRLKAYKYKRYVVKGTTKKTISYKSGYVKIRAYVKTTDARGNVKYIYGAWSDAKKIG